ncbi:helix-turn-helix transcriptional regulator [Amycolatopsis samaneae]|uniref:LuxR C-terminal-related transcriptional regulator n=1 Tax=Amycolatopsis samaneae TaxID=664691 RepID=A0ABW5GFW0_9PSEU
MKTVEVAILTSDRISRHGARSLLERHPEVTVLDDADRARASVLLVIEDVVTEPVLARLREAGAEREHPARAHCVVVTDRFDEAGILAAVECGVTAILPKAEIDSTGLITAVLGARNGTAHLSPRLLGALLARLDQIRRELLEPRGLTLSVLSMRERDVLRLVAEGLDTVEIAGKLSYSERTVKNTLYGLMARHDLKTRAHAVAYALRAGAL